MKKFIVAFIILINPITSYCQHPFLQNLVGIATITFPDTPKVKSISGERFFVLNYHNASYSAVGSSLESGVGDLLSKNNDSAYNYFISAMLKKVKGKILYKNNISIQGIKGVEFGASGKTTLDQPFYSYHRLLSLNDFLIDYSFSSLDSIKKNDAKITSFFDTFKLTIKPSEIRQDNIEELAYKTGKIVGVILILGLIAGIGFAIVFIIRRIT